MDTNNKLDLNKEIDLNQQVDLKAEVDLNQEVEFKPHKKEETPQPDNKKPEPDKKKVTWIIIGVALLVGIILAWVCPEPVEPTPDPQPTEDMNAIEPEYDGKVELEFYEDEEYYGAYPVDLEDSDKAYIQDFINLYSDERIRDIWDKVSQYEMDEDFYLMDENDERVNLVTGNKPFIIYFAGIYHDNNGNLEMEPVSGEVSALKQVIAKTEPDIYILPYRTDVSKEDIRELIPNSNYFYEENREIADLYSLVDGYYNVGIFFNAKGVPVYATRNCNIVRFMEYAQEVFENNVSMNEVLTALSDTYHAE